MLALGAAFAIFGHSGLPSPDRNYGPMHPFTASTIQGGQITVDEDFKRPVVLNFWATWCVPCALEMPRLQAAYQAYQSDGLVVIGINVGPEDTRDVEAFAINHQLSFPLIRDVDRNLETRYSIRGTLPTTIFIDDQGLIQVIKYGVLDESDLREGLNSLGLD